MASLRWAIRRDYESLVELSGWDLETWIRIGLRRNTIIYVLEEYELVVGFICYEFEGKTIRILNMAVWTRRVGHGRLMIDKLKSKPNRDKIIVDVNEYNLTMCLFLKSCGFRCTHINGEEYHFECKILE